MMLFVAATRCLSVTCSTGHQRAIGSITGREGERRKKAAARCQRSACTSFVVVLVA